MPDQPGDRWSLLILRDMMFGGNRHFRELLKSEEGIAPNILADRLRKLPEMPSQGRSETLRR